MKRLLAIFLLLPSLAFGQGAIVQSGVVVAHDFACFLANGTVYDCGISALNPVVLPSIASGSVLGNATGVSAVAAATTLTAMVDTLGTPAQGDVLYRNGSTWAILPAGTNGQFLKTLGAGANPAWASAAGTTYSAGTGLTLTSTTFSLTSPVTVALGGTGLSTYTSGGVVAATAAGTLASSAVLAQHQVLLGGGAGAVPATLGSTGTSGQVLTSAGAAADPTWATPGAGTVTSVATSSGITGGTITTTGTISCVAATSATKGCVTPDSTATHFLNGAGNWVAATNATYVTLSDVSQVFTGGIHPTAFAIGTVSSGTSTIDCGNGPIQTLTNGGAFTLAMSANDGSCVVRITNNGSAGAITFSGFSEGANTGDALTTTNASKFDISLTRIGGNPHWLASALQ